MHLTWLGKNADAVCGAACSARGLCSLQVFNASNSDLRASCAQDASTFRGAACSIDSAYPLCCYTSSSQGSLTSALVCPVAGAEIKPCLVLQAAIMNSCVLELTPCLHTSGVDHTVELCSFTSQKLTIHDLPPACRLLEEPSQELNALPMCWLQQLLDHVARPGQTVDDIVRRSAGLPYAFVALFAAEPGGRVRPLLQKGGPVELCAPHPSTSLAQPRCGHQSSSAHPGLMRSLLQSSQPCQSFS